MRRTHNEDFGHQIEQFSGDRLHGDRPGRPERLHFRRQRHRQDHDFQRHHLAPVRQAQHRGQELDPKNPRGRRGEAQPGALRHCHLRPAGRQPGHVGQDPPGGLQEKAGQHHRGVHRQHRRLFPGRRPGQGKGIHGGRRGVLRRGADHEAVDHPRRRIPGDFPGVWR